MKIIALNILLCFFYLNVQGQCIPSFSYITTSSCDTFIAPSNQILFNSGIYYDTLVKADGCDSIITIDLTIHQSSTNTLFVHTCGEPYISGSGATYSSSGLYIENHSTIHGCDSLVYIHTDITIHGDLWISVEACNQYTSDAGTLYSQSGAYNEYYTDSDGCDSIIMYTISIISIDSEITLTDPITLMANQSGASYQWVDCNNNYEPISEATNQTYTAKINGDYACIVSINHCSDTSACIRIGSLSIGENSNTFNIYPNPTKGRINLVFGNFNDRSISVYNTNEQLIFNEDHINSPSFQFEFNQAPGLYFIEVKTENLTKRLKLIVE